ncbi:leukocyte cysteine proteinase inhibitor 1-like [Chiloscyllium plagiosum]|uniref:leukocyte cysteine proteinase inhibitor 1-like n=1 Tax=Chiloscyllium plagiosum TaxID=36176 RepID=UPI001CB8376D|nr:leukocyte cysteine proteinase inhibitor 1-like [Chiloscyllium plagiosum]
MATQLVGGLTEPAAVTEEIQAIVQFLKPLVLERLNKPLHVYHAISYRSQLVAGMNYFIKVVIGDADDYIHMRVFQPLPGSGEKVSLSDIQMGKKLFDVIEYF